MAMLVSFGADAASLTQDFQDALGHDATFATALAEVDAQRLQARLARTSYYPEARFSVNQLDSDAGARRTIGITQPLINVDRWLALQEADPREAAAAARLDLSRSELALRLYKAIAALIEARERMTLNLSVVDALQVQVTGARRSFELGQGTVTDVRDTEVRLAQARSQSFALQAALLDAERQYQAVVGRPPQQTRYALRASPTEFDVPVLSEFMQRAALNPSVRASEVGVQLAEIGAKRAKAVFLPSLNAVAQRSQSSGVSVSSSSIALRMEVPLSASSLMRNGSAEVEVRRASEALRDARQKVALDIERLHAQLAAARAELPVRRDAIRAAELSVSANEQSFSGGVRTRIDVLNALQTKFQSQADYVSAQLRLGEALLSLQVTSAADLPSALAQVQALLFEP